MVRMPIAMFAALAAIGLTVASATPTTALSPKDVTSPMQNQVCNSLSGPFCLHLGADASYASYMTPIDPPSAGKAKDALDDTATPTHNKCFFRHFARSWMDAGGDENDLMSQQVKTSDECEQLCCAHPKCQSYTFWMGHTCFLRAKKNRPREEGNSFSANKLH